MGWFFNRKSKSTPTAQPANKQVQEEKKPSLKELWNNDEVDIKCSFSCNGKPYRFYKESCGGGNYLKLEYFNVYGYKLNEICTKKEYLVTYLELHYTSFDKDEKTTRIPLLSSEEHTAKELVEILTSVLKEYDDKMAKEKAEKEALLNQTVKVIDLDGDEFETKSYCSQFADNSLCLYTEGGKTYHTWLDCYTKWPEEMRNNFKHWNIIKRKDAIKQGFHKCSFCEQRDYDSDHIDDWIESLSEEDE